MLITFLFLLRLGGLSALSGAIAGLLDIKKLLLILLVN
jgi:hypothetical protein